MQGQAAVPLSLEAHWIGAEKKKKKKNQVAF